MLKLSADTISTILRWASEHPLVEVTGFVAEAVGVQRVQPMCNVARRPEVYYEWDPAEMRREWARMDALGERLVAIYHSHPHGRAQPSERDMEGALMPDVYHLIAYPVGDPVRYAEPVWRLATYECIEAGILVGAQMQVTA